MLESVRVGGLLAALSLVACVNDYVVRKGGDGAAEQGGDDESSSTSACDTDECDTSGTTTGHGDDGGPQVSCEPCEADADCGDAYDNCVNVDVIGQRCLISCPEAGCPEGSTCRSTISVDQVALMQCVPQAGACADPTGD
jgi:hypothetical protein